VVRVSGAGFKISFRPFRAPLLLSPHLTLLFQCFSLRLHGLVFRLLRHGSRMSPRRASEGAKQRSGRRRGRGSGGADGQARSQRAHGARQSAEEGTREHDEEGKDCKNGGESAEKKRSVRAMRGCEPTKTEQKATSKSFARYIPNPCSCPGPRLVFRCSLFSCFLTSCLVSLIGLEVCEGDSDCIALHCLQARSCWRQSKSLLSARRNRVVRETKHARSI
jgi:hypothetical protein